VADEQAGLVRGELDEGHGSKPPPQLALDPGQFLGEAGADVGLDAGVNEANQGLQVVVGEAGQGAQSAGQNASAGLTVRFICLCHGVKTYRVLQNVQAYSVVICDNLCVLTGQIRLAPPTLGLPIL